MVSPFPAGTLLLLLAVLPDVLRIRGGTVLVGIFLFGGCDEEEAVSTVVVAQGARSRTALNFCWMSAAKVGFMLNSIAIASNSYCNQNIMVWERWDVLDRGRKIPVYACRIVNCCRVVVPLIIYPLAMYSSTRRRYVTLHNIFGFIQKQ